MDKLSVMLGKLHNNLEDIILIKLGRLFNMCREIEKFFCSSIWMERNVRRWSKVLCEISFIVSEAKQKNVSEQSQLAFTKKSIFLSHFFLSRFLLVFIKCSWHLRSVTGADKRRVFFCSYINCRLSLSRAFLYSLNVSNLSEMPHLSSAMMSETLFSNDFVD